MGDSGYETSPWGIGESVFEPEIAAIVAGVTTSLLAPVGDSLGKRIVSAVQGSPGGGSMEQQFGAYEQLRRRSVELRATLDILWSMPVTVPGAIVGLPLRVRLVQRIPAQGAALNDAFLGVAMVGEQEVVKAAASLAQALQSVGRQVARQPRTGRRSHSQQARLDWAVFDGALQHYVACCRADLGIKALADLEQSNPD